MNLNEELTKLLGERKEKFQERNKNLKDIISHCNCDLFEIEKMIFNFRKMIIYNAPYDKIVSFEEEIKNKLEKYRQDFAITFFDGKTSFQLVDNRFYEFKDSEWKILNDVSGLSFKVAKLNEDIFFVIKCGCTYEIFMKYLESRKELMKLMEECRQQE
jgi:hypothetical protein